MKKPVVIVGIGEMAGVFARGFLRIGHPVYPVTRDLQMQEVAEAISDPEAVLVAVAETALPGVLEQLPPQWRERLCLLQNELLPGDWTEVGQPTVISVWFEKKRGMDAKVIIPSPVYGPGAGLLAEALAALDIPTRVLASEDQLLFELVVKNLYILTSNIAGLRTGGTVGELWQQHNAFARDVAADVIRLQEAMTGSRFDSEALLASMLEAFEGDPQHNCMGRSAPARLARALETAERHKLELPTLNRIASETAQ